MTDIVGVAHRFIAHADDPEVERRISLRDAARRLRVCRWAERVRGSIAGRLDEGYLQELDREARHYGMGVGFETRVRVPIVTRTGWGEVPLRAMRMRDGWRFQPQVDRLTRIKPILRSKIRRRVQQMLPWWSLEELNK